MKINPYLKYVLIGLVYILMWVLNAIIVPFIYPWVEKIRKNETPFLVWFVNKDEPTDLENNYGDLGFLKRKGIDIENSNKFMRWLYYMNWNIIRNSFWYFKVNYFVPNQGELTDINIIKFYGNGSPTEIRNVYFKGLSYITFRIEDVKYFRFSIAKKIKWFGGEKFWNVQLGASTNRWLYKFKISKIYEN